MEDCDLVPPGNVLRGDAEGDEEKEGNSPLDCKPRENGPDDEGCDVIGIEPPDCTPRENGEDDCCASMDEGPLFALPG